MNNTSQTLAPNAVHDGLAKTGGQMFTSTLSLVILFLAYLAIRGVVRFLKRKFNHDTTQAR